MEVREVRALGTKLLALAGDHSDKDNEVEMATIAIALLIGMAENFAIIAENTKRGPASV